MKSYFLNIYFAVEIAYNYLTLSCMFSNFRVIIVFVFLAVVCSVMTFEFTFTRGVIRTRTNIFDEMFLQNSLELKAFRYFRKKALS